MNVSQMKEINIKLLRAGRRRSNVSNIESGYYELFFKRPSRPFKIIRLK